MNENVMFGLHKADVGEFLHGTTASSIEGEIRVVRAATHALPVSGPCMIRFHDSERLKPLCVGVGVWAYPQRNGCEPQDVRLAPTEQAPPVRGPHSPARQASKRHAKYTPRRRVLSRNRPVRPNSLKKEGISGSTAVPLVSKKLTSPHSGWRKSLQ